MSKSISILKDHRVEVYVDKYLQPEEAKALATELVATADKAIAEAKAAKIKSELDVFDGAKPGDMFVAGDGTVFVLADPTKSGYPADSVILWRIRERSTYATAAWWKNDGYADFKKARAAGWDNTLETSTIGRRQAFIQGEGLL